MDLNQIHDEILRKRLGTDPRVPDETGAISRPSVGGEISNHYLQLARELPTTVQKEQEKKNIFQRAGAFVRNVITGAPKQEDQIQRQTDAYLQEIARGVRLEEPEPRKGIIKEFTDASWRTFWNTISQIEGFRGLTAALHGREKAVVKSRLDDAEALQYKAGQYQATIQRIEDVRGLGDFARWGVRFCKVGSVYRCRNDAYSRAYYARLFNWWCNSTCCSKSFVWKKSSNRNC